MRRVIPITEHYQRYLENLKEGFWGDLYGQTRMFWKRALEEQSARLRDVHLRCDPYERKEEEGRDYRNGFYERDFVTRLGVLRLKIARTRQKSFLPGMLKGFQRRAEEVMMLIREAFLRGISTRQVGAWWR